MNKEQNKLVVKSNHIIEASFKLSLQEQRLILLMVSMIKKNDRDFQIYRISIDDFNKVVGLKGESTYSGAKEIIRKLKKRELVIKKPESELLIDWLSSAEYFPQKGYIELCFDPKLKPYLLNLQKQFTKYQLKNAIHLKSSYSIRLYEIMKQNEFRKERAFKIETLRSMLGLKPDEYKLYADFKKRIIVSSQKELNKKTDISFEFQEKKKGRKVVEIVFKIRSNSETGKVGKQKAVPKKPLQQPPLSDQAQQAPSSDDLQSILNLVPVKITDPIRKLISDYHSSKGHDYVKRNIEYTNNQIRDKRKYRAYLGKSLANDYALDWIEDKETAEAEEKVRIKTETEKQKKNTEKRVNKKDAKRLDLHDRMKEELKAMPAERIEELRKGCLKNATPFVRKRLEKMPVSKLVSNPSFLDYCALAVVN